MAKAITNSFKLALAQLNPVVGDIAGNLAKAREARARAGEAGADLIVFTELYLTGYPIADLVLQPALQKAAREASEPIDFRGLKLGVPICEDIWSEEVCEVLADAGAKLLIVPNGSPYWIDKQEVRYGVAETRVAETRLSLAYINQVGGQDELVFDGASFVLNEDAALAVQMPAWEEAVGVTEWHCENGRWRCFPGLIAEIEEGDAANYLACVTGLRDYVDKNGFPG